MINENPSDEAPKEDPQSGFFSALIKTFCAIVILGAIKSPVLYYLWNLVIVKLTYGCLPRMELWDAILFLVSYDILSYYTFRNITDESVRVIATEE